MKRSFYRYLAVFVLVTAAAGCASIVGKTMHPVVINSKPDQADIVIVDEGGKTVFAGKTPTTVTLSGGDGYFHAKDYSVTFSKPGFEQHTTVIKRDVSMWYVLGNILFGGLIGWLIVDPVTGAMWTLQEDVTATLAAKNVSGSTGHTLRIATVNEVPPRYLARMVRIR